MRRPSGGPSGAFEEDVFGLVSGGEGGGAVEVQGGTRIETSVPPHDPEEAPPNGLAPDGALPG